MRLGVILEPSDGQWSLDELVDQATAAELVGIDVCGLVERGTDDAAWSTTVLAAALGARTRAARLACFLGVGHHPVELAEEIAVADLATGGRLAVVIDPTTEPGVLDETLSVLLAALAPRPFRHTGRRWTVPVPIEGRPGSEEELVRVTPASAQLEVPVTVLGMSSVAVSAAHGLPPVAAERETATSELRDIWSDLERIVPGARHRWRRTAIRALEVEESGAFDDEEVVSGLQLERSAWGLDTCIFRLRGASGEPGRRAAIDRLGRRVRPRVQLASLPAGLEESWRCDREDG